MRRSTAAGAVVLMAVLASPLAGQEAAGAGDARWFTGIALEHEFIDADAPPWTDWSTWRAFVVRDVEGGAWGAEVFRVDRFGARDLGVALDGYRTLWPGAYAHLRLRGTPDAEVLPRTDGRIELFQALSGGWEASASWWHMEFPSDDVGVFGVGAARYVESWYLRGVASLGRLAGGSAASASFTARRYLAPPREFVELAAGFGNEVVVLGPGPAIDTRETRFVQARIQRFLGPRWGVSAGLGWNTFEGAPSRFGLAAGVLGRF